MKRGTSVLRVVLGEDVAYNAQFNLLIDYILATLREDYQLKEIK